MDGVIWQTSEAICLGSSYSPQHLEKSTFLYVPKAHQQNEQKATLKKNLLLNIKQNPIQTWRRRQKKKKDDDDVQSPLDSLRDSFFHLQECAFLVFLC